MPVATCMIRSVPHYRRESFVAGLRRVGYDVVDQPPRRIRADDVCVIWNRSAIFDGVARRFEMSGARVLVAENGYVAGPGKKWFAMALDHHNGAGRWPTGGGERWAALEFDLAPWRTGDGYVLVLPQRGIGARGVAMPRGWEADVRRRLAGVTRRQVIVRPHPGGAAPKRSLADDLAGAWAAVLWGSGAGHYALLAGVPVFHEFERWIGAPAAVHGIANIEGPRRDDAARLAMFERLAWAQWSVEEVESGAAFDALLKL